MIQRRIALCLGIVALIVAGLPAGFGAARPATVPSPIDDCEQGPINSSSGQVNELDQFADDWGVFCEASPITGGFSTWLKQNTARPSLEGQALQCSLTGGAPYANIHCYRSLLTEPATIGITRYWF